ncbi:hypothetical protein IAR50_004219 [Cryptococcus sp. DSM 104548]
MLTNTADDLEPHWAVQEIPVESLMAFFPIYHTMFDPWTMVLSCPSLASSKQGLSTSSRRKWASLCSVSALNEDD